VFEDVSARNTSRPSNLKRLPFLFDNINNMTLKLFGELLSAVLILLGFELFNRKSIKAFHVMAVGQLLAAVICVYADLWFLSIMHVVNFIMQIRGYMKWQGSGMEAVSDGD